MVLTLLQIRTARRRRGFALHATLLVLILNVVCFAQTENGGASTPAGVKPLTADERAELLKLIKSLQERVEKLEAAQASPQNNTSAPATLPPVATSTPVEPVTPENTPAPGAATTKQDDEDKFDGRYTPNLGFKLANTEYGDMNVSIYTYVRYLNQLGLDSTYIDALGNTKNVQERQDVQLLKLQI